MQTFNLITCGYFCNGITDFMLRDKGLLYYKNSFSPKKYEKNDKISVQTYNFITNKVTRNLNIIFADKKHDVVVLSY